METRSSSISMCEQQAPVERPGEFGIKWVMLVSGLLTCTMFYAALSPQAALRSAFGETLDGPVASIVVRNWGALIGLVGLALIYGAFNPAARWLALMVAAASKAVFVALVLTSGRPYLGHRVGVSVAVDSVMVLVFVGYLLRRESAAA